SFDRLFPNQDFLSGKGLGNLIALPFFKPAMEKGNSCFINPETLESYADQKKFLTEIKKTSTDLLDRLFQQISKESPYSIPERQKRKLLISLQRNIHIHREGLTTPLINFLKEELNFANSEFFIKQKSGKSTFETERYFRLVEEVGNEIIIPRGFLGMLLRFCKESNIAFDFQDLRILKNPAPFSFNATLRSH